MPDWGSDRNPSARDIAKAAGALGVPYTLVTGIPLPDQFIDNVLASPQAVLGSEKFERFEAIFSGAGDTLSAALAALLAGGSDLAAAATEALSYLDRCLDAGFRPGMGNVAARPPVLGPARRRRRRHRRPGRRHARFPSL